MVLKIYYRNLTYANEGGTETAKVWKESVMIQKKKKKKRLVANQSKILQPGHQRGQAWEANEWASGGLFRKPCFPVVPTPINCNEQLSVNLGPLLIT